MNIENISNRGHFAKAFQAEQQIPAEIMEQLINFLHFSASSVNCQPWRFIVVSKQEEKDKIAELTARQFSANEHKIKDASHLIIFCTMTDLTTEYLNHVHEQELADGRFTTPEQSKIWQSIVHGWIDSHRCDVKDLFHWMEKQTYLAMGSMLMAAAGLGVDAAPLEGFDSKLIDGLYDLRQRGLTTTLMLSLGYRDVQRDFAMNLPKSRLPREELFTFI